MVKKKESKKKISKNKIDKNNQKLFAFLASFFTIIGFIIALILWKDDKYVMFYAKQGLVLFIAQIIIMVLYPLLFLVWVLWVLWFILWIITWINALSGQMKDTFIIGDIAEKIRV